MTFLPIVIRELQVAARRPSTFRTRFLGATGATLLGGLFLMASSLPGALAPSGKSLFWMLVYVAFAYALLSGILLTADCLSCERREGTLGFLFLTDLGGWDVVAGKLVALGLVPLHGLLSVFPVAAMAVFLGGITWGEFSRALVGVLDSMFVSLAVGMWCSSRNTDDRRAVISSVVVMVAWSLVPELAGAAIGFVGATPVWEGLRAAGPTGLLRHAGESLYSGSPAAFWVGAVLQGVIAAALIAGAAWRVQRNWRCDEVRIDTSNSREPVWMPGIVRAIRERQERRLRRHGLLAWLGWQGNWVRSTVRWVAGVTAAVSVTTFLAQVGSARYAAGSRAVVVVAVGFWILKLLLAVHSVHLLQELRRNGLMEALLVTPVSGRSLWAGHLAAVRAIFLWPVVALAVVQLGLGVAGRVVVGGDWPSWGVMIVTGLVPTLLTLAVHALDFLAVAYYSARCALVYDRPAKGLIRTALMAMLLPALFCSYGRFVVDLLILADNAQRLDQFRDLARSSLVPRMSDSKIHPPRLRGR